MKLKQPELVVAAARPHGWWGDPPGTRPGIEPTTIDIARDAGVTLTWDDGTVSRFELDALREHCPCAECRMLRERQLPVGQRPASAPPLRIVDAALVGAWGLNIVWSDGHRTGIYSWEQLRFD